MFKVSKNASHKEKFAKNILSGKDDLLRRLHSKYEFKCTMYIISDSFHVHCKYFYVHSSQHMYAI